MDFFSAVLSDFCKREVGQVNALPLAGFQKQRITGNRFVRPVGDAVESGGVTVAVRHAPGKGG